MLMRNMTPRNVNQLSLTPFNDIFDDHFHFENTFSSKLKMNMDLDVKHTDESIEISADLPGVSKDNVLIDFDQKSNILTISGERTSEKKNSLPVDENSNEQAASKSNQDDNKKVLKEKFIFTERSYGKTSRSIRLPQGIDVDGIQASMDNGVLNISIPKPEEREYKRRITLE